MKQNTLLILLITILSLTSCAQKKLATNEKAAYSYVRMMRTPCFGRCPNYAIEVYDDGTVKYFGYIFTKHQGVYEYKAGKEKTAKYINMLASFQPDTCKESYEVLISDLPGINYDYTTQKGEEKKIYNAQFGPKILQYYAAQLDSAFTPNSDWKMIADTALR